MSAALSWTDGFEGISMGKHALIAQLPVAPAVGNIERPAFR
ncbi:hypothetical protein [Wenzhouxiangella sp. 15181]|nr:hypothetical protein [Wenzhouxiangella sp. 15181]